MIRKKKKKNDMNHTISQAFHIKGVNENCQMVNNFAEVAYLNLKVIEIIMSSKHSFSKYFYILVIIV